MNSSVKSWLLHVTAAKLRAHQPSLGACEEWEVPQDGKSQKELSTLSPDVMGDLSPVKGRIFLKITFLALAVFSAECGWERAVLTRLLSSPDLALLRRKSWNWRSFFICSLTAVQTEHKLKAYFSSRQQRTRIHPPAFENWPYKKGSSNFFPWDMVKFRLSSSLACGFTIGSSWHKTGSCGKRWFCPPISRFLPLHWLGIPAAWGAS